MSLAFQKLNGQGTQMQTLIDSVNKSDLYKMAKEFAPNVNLTPIVKSWEIGINENPVNDLSLDGLYFGKWFQNHNSQDVGNNDNSRKRSEAYLKFGNEVVTRTMIIVHGDDILSWKTATTELYGFATSLHLHKLEADDQPQHGVQVSFIGYKIANNPNFVFPTPTSVINPAPDFDGNVHFTTQDLTTAGYTYQWSVLEGTGTFVNPNIPNAVFVPDGNGYYMLKLDVTDADGVSSAPVQIPVNIDFGTITMINNTTVDIFFDHSAGGITLVAGQNKKLFRSVNQSYGYYQYNPCTYHDQQRIISKEAGVVVEDISTWAEHNTPVVATVEGSEVEYSFVSMATKATITNNLDQVAIVDCIHFPFQLEIGETKDTYGQMLKTRIYGTPHKLVGNGVAPAIDAVAYPDGVNYQVDVVSDLTNDSTHYDINPV